MKNEAKDRAEVLQWFVDFANMDLRHIGEGDKAKLMIEGRPIFASLPEEATSLYPEKLKWMSELVDMNVLIEIQGAIRYFFRNYLGPVLSPMASISIAEDPMSEGQDILRQDAPIGMAFDNPETGERYVYGVELFQWDLTRRQNQTFHFEIIPIAESRKKHVLIQIMKLLEGFPGYVIQTCPSCDKYFLNVTRRKKNFCSSQCLWRVNAKKWRKAHRKDYLENQRKLMKNRRKGKYGPRSKYTNTHLKNKS